MIRAAITGGLACGKSTVLGMFAALPHVATLSADEIVHPLYEPGEPVYRPVVAAAAERRGAVIEVPALSERRSEGKCQRVIAVVGAPEKKLARLLARHRGR